jgi:hypothetical protein
LANALFTEQLMGAAPAVPANPSRAAIAAAPAKARTYLIILSPDEPVDIAGTEANAKCGPISLNH